MNTKFEIKEFYVQLGKLAYAVAIADGRVQHEEIKDLHKLVRNELMIFEQETDEFDTNLAFYTEFEFETRIESKSQQGEIYDSFIKYLKENRKFITPQLKNICINTVKKIAEAYGGIVDNEKIIIDKLEKDFEKL